jgi:hypothetical protein
MEAIIQDIMYIQQIGQNIWSCAIWWKNPDEENFKKEKRKA